MEDLLEYLGKKRYPGRGIAIGMDEEGLISFAYFIMGRSENSRNRIFVKDEEGLHTRIFDEEKLKDPSLILYDPMRIACDGSIVVSNGDQTDTICEGIAQGRSFEEALRTRSFEPDEPNWTPRISCLIRKEGYILSILKRSAKGGCCRQFFEYPFEKGCGHIIHTYVDDGSPLPSFEGEPVSFMMEKNLYSIGEELWKSLDSDNRISLYVRAQSVDAESVSERIFNKNAGD